MFCDGAQELCAGRKALAWPSGKRAQGEPRRTHLVGALGLDVEDVQADAAAGVYVWVVHGRHEPHQRRLQRVPAATKTL